MQIIHAEVRESEEAAEITREIRLGSRDDRIEPGSFGGMCDAAVGRLRAQFHRRQFTRKVCVYGSAPNGHGHVWRSRSILQMGLDSVATG